MIRFVSHFWSKIIKLRGCNKNVLVFCVYFPERFSCGGRKGREDVYSGLEGSTSTVLENYPDMNSNK